MKSFVVTLSGTSAVGLLLLSSTSMLNVVTADSPRLGVPSTKNAFAIKDSILDRIHSRFLQTQFASDVPPKQPPSRTCGQILAFATVDQIKQVAKVVITLLLDPVQAAVALTALDSVIRYDVHAQVVCASCEEVRELYGDAASFLLDKSGGRHAFPSYCGPSRFASNVTTSSLLLTPYEMGKPVEGVVKSHIFMKGYTGLEQFTPSEFYVDDFDAWNTTDRETQSALFENFYDGWTSLFIASAGVITIAPDYLGYGQSYETPKGNGIFDLYQQAVSVAFLKSKSIVEMTGCTVVGTSASASGYSEGGAGAVAAALALKGLGQEILNVDTGGAPFRPAFQLAHAIDLIDNNGGVDEELDNETVTRDQFAIGATFYSSKFPDVINSNMGQDMLNSEWRDLIVSLSNTDLAFAAVGPFLPNPATDILNNGFLEKVRGLLAQNITDACYSSIEGVDDLLCLAILGNTFIDFVESTTFPISICHSPVDDVIPIEHAPASISGNPLLYELKVLGQGPTLGHFESSVFCYTAYVLQFSEFGSAPVSLKGIDPLPDPSTCLSPNTATPVTATSMGPTTVTPNTAAPVESPSATSAAPVESSAAPESSSIGVSLQLTSLGGLLALFISVLY